MMRVNLKQIAVVLMVVMLFGCARSPEARRDRYLSRGKALIQKKQFSRAVLELRNAANLVPGDAEVFYQMGVAFLGAHDINSASAAFLRAVSLNPGHAAAQLKFAQIQSNSDDPERLKDAESRLKTLLAGGSPTTDTLSALAFTELKLGNPQDAIYNFEQALAQTPGELFSSLMLSRAKLAVNDIKGAEAVLQKASSDAPKSADARRFLGEFYLSQDRRADAETAFRQALALEPKNGATLLDFGRLEFEEGRQQDAEQTFKQLRTIDGYKSTYGIFLYQAGRRADAIREFERVLKENPDDRQMRTNLVVAYRTSNRSGDADKLLQRALEKNSKDADALLERAEIAIGNGQYAEAELDLAQVLKLEPTAPEAHYVMARLDLVRGMVLTYRQELSESLRLKPELVTVRVELAQDLINAKQFKAALDVVDAAPAFQHSWVALLVQRNWALWGIGDMAEMRKGIDQGLAIAKTSDLMVQDGLWKLRTGNSKGARTTLEDALHIDPADMRALEGIRASYLAEKNPSMALEKVKEYAAQYPKSAPIQDFLGMMFLSAGDRNQARTAFEAANTDDPKSVGPEMMLVQIDVSQNKVDDAQKRLQGILSKNSENSTARLWLGNLEEMRGQHDLARENFRKAVSVDASNAQANNNLAYLLIDTQPEEALKFAQKAIELRPNWPAYCDTLGWALYRKGLYSAAVPYLERAASDKGDPVWTYHLAMAYAKAGDLARGRTTLQAALKEDPNVPEAKLAQELLGRGN